MPLVTQRLLVSAAQSTRLVLTCHSSVATSFVVRRPLSAFPEINAMVPAGCRSQPEIICLATVQPVLMMEFNSPNSLLLRANQKPSNSEETSFRHRYDRVHRFSAAFVPLLPAQTATLL